MHRTHLNIVATLETTIGRLPANIEAERSILGAVLLDNHAFNDAAEHLKPEDFSIDSHRRIYSRMMDLAESPRPFTFTPLAEDWSKKRTCRRSAMSGTSPACWTASPTGRRLIITFGSSATRRFCAG